MAVANPLEEGGREGRRREGCDGEGRERVATREGCEVCGRACGWGGRRVSRCDRGVVVTERRVGERVHLPRAPS